MVDKRRVAHAVGLLALLVVVVPFVIYAFPSVAGADHSFVVLSGSMEPEIAPGDVVIVDERSTEAIEDGDVITFVRSEGDKPVTHRVVGVEERGDTTVFRTKGDANEDADNQPVPATNVIGEVTVTIPYIGHVVQFAQRPVGFVVLVLVPLGLLGLSEVWTLVRKQGGDDGAADVGEGTVATSAADASTDDDGEITLTATDLTLATGILALTVPYTVYVALNFRTPVTFTAAFAAAFSFLGVGGLWLTARGDGGGAAAPAPGDDDGDGFAFDPEAADGDDGWPLADRDGTVAVDDPDALAFDDGDTGFADAFDAEFGDDPADGATADAEFFEDPSPTTDATGFDDAPGGTEEVD